MAIFRNSRYTGTPVYRRRGKLVFKNRSIKKFNLDDAKLHIFQQGESLGSIAKREYNDSQLWWVILEANPEYDFVWEIEFGDELIIPSRREVRRALNDKR